MGVVLLVRHGRSTANVQRVLAGRTPGVDIDETGREQAGEAAGRLRNVALDAIVSSPLQRCQQTAEVLNRTQTGDVAVTIEPAVIEVDYGTWTGQPMEDLSKEALWKVVQRQPSEAVFPGGEGLADVSRRAVGFVRAFDRALTEQLGRPGIWACVSHGDVIKSIVADAFGMHLDQFQRIVVNPASISVVRYSPAFTQVLATNTQHGDVGWAAQGLDEPQQAEVGGGAGPDRPGTKS